MSLNLLDLHLELIYIILEYVHNSSPHTTRSVARVNKYLRDAARVVRHRRRTLYLESQHRSTGLDANEFNWVRDTTILSSIRHLTINELSRQRRDLSQEDEDVYMDLICDLIERIGNLKSLTWNIGPMPKRVVKLLGEKHPNATLRIFNYWRKDPSIDHLTEDEIAVCTFKNLTDFRAVVLHNHPQNPIFWNKTYCIDAYKHMIANSSTLQYAGIVDSGVGGGSATEHDFTLDTVKHTRCESLRSLTLDTTSIELSKGLLDDWNGFVNMAQLETLKFVRGHPMLDYFQTAAMMLPNIKHVSLNFAHMASRFSGNDKDELPKAANKYLLTCSPMTSLSIWNASKFVDMDELINHHSETIEVLQVHHNDSYGSRPGLPIQTISLMKEKCLKLRDLTLDFNRKDYTILHPPFEMVNLTLSENQKGLDILDEIALLGARLDKVQFYVESINVDLEASLLVSPDGYVRYSANDDSDSDDDGEDSDDDDSGEPDNGNEDDSNGEDPIEPQEDEADEVEGTTSRSFKRQSMPWEDLMQQYVEDIWKRVFGAQDFGDRAVDVKFGEWESKFRNLYYDNRRWFEVRPHERNDRPGEYFTKVSKFGSWYR